MSRLFWSFADIEKQATCRSYTLRRLISSIISSSVNAPSMSVLLPRMRRGMPYRDGHSKSWCNYFFASSIAVRSTESTTNIMTSDARQYFSQESRKRSCPPRSQTFMLTLPFRIRLKLKPIVGIVSSSNVPFANVFVSVDFPAF